MPAIAQFLPDFLEEEIPSADSTDSFILFETGQTEGYVWQELFDRDETHEQAEGVNPRLNIVPSDPSNENSELQEKAQEAQSVVSQPKIRAITVEEHESILADLEKHHEKQMDELKQTCGEWLLRDLDELKSQAVEQLVCELESAIAKALVPLGLKHQTDRATQQLASEIKSILSEKTALAIRLVGPESLIEPIMSLIGEDADYLTTEIAQQPELTLETDGAIIRTSIGRWVERLDGVLNA